MAVGGRRCVCVPVSASLREYIGLQVCVYEGVSVRPSVSAHSRSLGRVDSRRQTNNIIFSDMMSRPTYHAREVTQFPASLPCQTRLARHHLISLGDEIVIVLAARPEN